MRHRTHRRYVHGSHEDNYRRRRQRTILAKSTDYTQIQAAAFRLVWGVERYSRDIFESREWSPFGDFDAHTISEVNCDRTSHVADKRSDLTKETNPNAPIIDAEMGGPVIGHSYYKMHGWDIPERPPPRSDFETHMTNGTLGPDTARRFTAWHSRCQALRCEPGRYVTPTTVAPTASATASASHSHTYPVEARNTRRDIHNIPAGPLPPPRPTVLGMTIAPPPGLTKAQSPPVKATPIPGLTLTNAQSPPVKATPSVTKKAPPEPSVSKKPPPALKAPPPPLPDAEPSAPTPSRKAPPPRLSDAEPSATQLQHPPPLPKANWKVLPCQYRETTATLKKATVKAPPTDPPLEVPMKAPPTANPPITNEPKFPATAIAEVPMKAPPTTPPSTMAAGDRAKATGPMARANAAGPITQTYRQPPALLNPQQATAFRESTAVRRGHAAMVQIPTAEMAETRFYQDLQRDNLPYLRQKISSYNDRIVAAAAEDEELAPVPPPIRETEEIEIPPPPPDTPGLRLLFRVHYL